MKNLFFIISFPGKTPSFYISSSLVLPFKREFTYPTYVPSGSTRDTGPVTPTSCARTVPHPFLSILGPWEGRRVRTGTKIGWESQIQVLRWDFKPPLSIKLLLVGSNEGEPPNSFLPKSVTFVSGPVVRSGSRLYRGRVEKIRGDERRSSNKWEGRRKQEGDLGNWVGGGVTR